MAQIQSRIEPNSFSADLAPVIRRYFSSHEQELDEDIFSKAYISSNEVTGYDRILESYLKDRLAKSKNLTQIKTTKNKSAELTEAINSYSQRRSVSGQMQLVTGGVGAGKSLFARRYKEFLQPAQLKNRNHWSFLNFNNAPDDPKQWQDWVCETFVASLREEGSSVDASDEETQESIFAPDLAEKKAYYDRMERAQPGRRDLEMARDIEAWRQDSKKLTTSIARYIQGDRGENLIVVFDNVDRRESSAQLAAFQTALWFMSQTRAMVILQLRDSTFEAFKDEPPLDTYKTGKIFHISPPRFVDVVKRRLELSMSEFSNAPSEMVSFQTSKGLTVSYPKSRAAEFLRGVYLELFQYSKNSARILEALAGKNVRRALDMFMALITSGHMPEETILSVAQGHGVGRIPDYRILRAIMRQDYRFFNESSGFISNIFYCSSQWERPGILLVPELLFILINYRKVRGDNGQMGFVAVERIVLELEYLGFVRSDIFDAVKYCVKKELLEVDTLSMSLIRSQDCLKATASGWIHMRLLTERVEYVAPLLPTTAIDDEQFSMRIYDAMQIEMTTGFLTLARMSALLTEFCRYLKGQHDKQLMHPGYAALRHSGGSYVLQKVQRAVEFQRMRVPGGQFGGDLLDL